MTYLAALCMVISLVYAAIGFLDRREMKRKDVQILELRKMLADKTADLEQVRLNQEHIAEKKKPISFRVRRSTRDEIKAFENKHNTQEKRAERVVAALDK